MLIAVYTAPMSGKSVGPWEKHAVYADQWLRRGSATGTTLLKLFPEGRGASMCWVWIVPDNVTPQTSQPDPHTGTTGSDKSFDRAQGQADQALRGLGYEVL